MESAGVFVHQLFGGYEVCGRKERFSHVAAPLNVVCGHLLGGNIF